MKIIYDSHIFCTQKNGGISKYYLEISKNAKFEYIIPFIGAFIKNKEFQNINEINESILIKIPKIHGLIYNTKLLSLLNQYKINESIKTNKPSIYHATSQLYYVPENIKKVVTIHDFIFERITAAKQNSPMNKAFSIMQKEKEKQINNSDKIIVISNNTKKDLLFYYPKINQDKIEVIYHGGVNNLSTTSVNLPEKYILYVGNRKSYKNFKILLDSFQFIAKKNKNISLVCVGGGDPNKEETENCKQKDILDKIYFLKNIDNNQLNYIYQKALLFVYPSLYEGFGIPILEAFANKCPVLLSNTSCFPEIAQESALYFNPFEKNDLSDKIEKLIMDKSLREKIVELGIKRNNDFSWQKSSEEHYKLYKSI